MSEEHSASLGMHNGAMSLFIDGEVQPFTTVKVNEHHDLQIFKEITRDEIPRFARDGITICWIPIFIEWKGPGEYDFSGMDDRINHVLSAYDANTPENEPKVLIVIRIQAAVFFPKWYLEDRKVDGKYTNKVQFRNYWGASEPDEINYEKERYSTRNPRYGEPYAVSPGDKFWDTHAVDCLKAIVAHAKTQPYHERVIGYLHCALSTNEWFLHSDSPDSCCDFSAPTQRAFFDYLQEKGIDCTHEPVPTPRECFGKKDLLLNPGGEVDRRIEEFSIFLNRRVADIIENFSRVIKDCYKRNNKLVGCFYGYTMEISPTYNLAQSAHIAARRLMDSPHIDLFCTPVQYRYRQDVRPFTYGQVHGVVADSMRLHNKLVFAEDDHWPADHGLFSRDNWHDRMYFLRNFASVGTHGQSMWWYSIGYHWFKDPERCRWIAELHRIGKRAMEMDRSSVSEVAVVIDERSVSAIRPNPDFWKDAMLHTYAGIYPAGTPFEIFELQTFLDKADTARYKTVVFVNLFRTDDSILEKLERWKSGGRTLVFLGFAGIMRDDARNVRSITAESSSALTGFKMRKCAEKLPYSLWIDPDRIGFLSPKEDLRFGTEAIYPDLLCVEDPDAEAIAFLGDGSIGMARKNFADWTSVFAAASPLPDKVWRKLFTDAGVHCYALCGDVAYANASMVAYSASSWGEKTLTMPFPERLTDVFTGEKIVTDGKNTCRFHLRRHEVRIFFREKLNEIKCQK